MTSIQIQLGEDNLKTWLSQLSAEALDHVIALVIVEMINRRPMNFPHSSANDSNAQEHSLDVL